MSEKIENLPAEEYKRTSRVEENFNVLKRYEDPRFGPVSIIEVPGNQRRLMCREKSFGSKNELTREIIAAKRRLAVGDPHLLSLIDYSTGERSNFCSSDYWIKLFFEFPDHDIEQEQRRRIKSGLIGFNSSELTHMLYNIVQGGAALNKAGMYHGDICPQTIEMDNPESYKLVERFGELASPQDYQLTRIVKGGDLYSAPEIYNRAKNPPRDKKAPGPNYRSADVFSLGLTLLRAGTDDQVQTIYNKNGTLDYSKLENVKRDFAAKFPENNLLVSTVCAMLDPEPANRPRDFEAMLNELPPYNLVRDTLRQQQGNFGQTSQVQQIQNPQNVYNQYVAQSAWEQSWTAQANPANQQQRNAGILGSHLSLPQENRNVVIAQQAPQQSTSFGVVPPLGQGIPQYQQTTTTQGVSYAPQPGAGLQQGLAPATVQYTNIPGAAGVYTGNDQVPTMQRPITGQNATTYTTTTGGLTSAATTSGTTVAGASSFSTTAPRTILAGTTTTTGTSLQTYTPSQGTVYTPSTYTGQPQQSATVQTRVSSSVPALPLPQQTASVGGQGTTSYAVGQGQGSARAY